MEVKHNEIYEYVFEEGISRSLESVFCGPIQERHLPVSAILSYMKLQVRARMRHCRENLLTNNSGVHFSSEHLVIFSDNSCFTVESYRQMEIARKSKAKNIPAFFSELSTLGIIQVLKAVVDAPNGRLKAFAIGALTEEILYREQIGHEK